jgi:pyrroline-5-carboxylate reductase
MSTPENTPHTLAFIGGGNMASAIIGGLIKRGLAPGQIQVVEPFAEQATKLQSQFGVRVMASAQTSLGSAALVVWAVKPQIFAQAAEQAGPHVRSALHLSVAAGIGTDTLARWLGSERIVRAMPNTPALIGQGMMSLGGGGYGGGGLPCPGQVLELWGGSLREHPLWRPAPPAVIQSDHSGP